MDQVLNLLNRLAQPVLNQEQILAVANQQASTYVKRLLRNSLTDSLLPFGQRPDFWPADFDTSALMGLDSHAAVGPFLDYCGLPLNGSVEEKLARLYHHLTGRGPHLFIAGSGICVYIYMDSYCTDCKYLIHLTASRDSHSFSAS